METRAARRKAAAAAQHTKDRSRRTRPLERGSRTPPAGASRPPATVQPDSEAEPEALVVSHSFDPGDEGESYSATIRLTGRRVGLLGEREPQDAFVQEDKIEGVLPGSGPVSVSSWVYGLRPGEWTVSAELRVSDGDGRHVRRMPVSPMAPAQWSWRRWSVSGGSVAPIKTRWAILAPVARIPAVMPGSWPALAGLGGVVALVTQAAVLGHRNVAIGPSMVVLLAALVAGMIGAKVWYAVLHPAPWRRAILGGWAVDGFLVVAPLVALVTLLALKLPVGVFLDAAVPGLFFGVAIGRLGCFFTGCCAGRFSTSRWSVWSSDRRIGARRVPAQLLESAAGLVIGLTAMALILGHTPRIDGTIFVLAFVAYFVVRQLLLRVRAERREFSWRRRVVTVAELA